MPFNLASEPRGTAFGRRSLQRNNSDLRDIFLRQRVLRDVSAVSTEIELFGQRMSLPLALSPVGMAGMLARRGEVQAMRAVGTCEVPFTLSTMSLCSLEEVAQSSGYAPWFQLYMIRDRDYMRDLLARACAVGAEVLVFTVDLPVPGVRRSTNAATMTSLIDRAKLAWEGISHPGWLVDVHLRGKPHVFGNISAALPNARTIADFFSWIQKNGDASVTWNDLAWLRSHGSGAIVLKGILDPEDAREAVANGADGIIVSNHGGRQLDSTPSTISVLPEIVQSVAGARPVLIDGGIRSGLDVMKALALGASGCMVGRAWAYALASGGEAGVAHLIQLFRLELRTAMALAGCTSVADVNLEVLLQR